MAIETNKIDLGEHCHYDVTISRTGTHPTSRCTALAVVRGPAVYGTATFPNVQLKTTVAELHPTL